MGFGASGRNGGQVGSGQRQDQVWIEKTVGRENAHRVLAADFVNNGRAYSAVWFRDAQGKGGYYGFDGQSKKRAFLASPMEFSRVTSGFAMRMHPILNSWKQHKGVDYGAPTGTPIRAVGDGVVEFAGWQNGRSVLPVAPPHLPTCAGTTGSISSMPPRAVPFTGPVSFN